MPGVMAQGVVMKYLQISLLFIGLTIVSSVAKAEPPSLCKANEEVFFSCSAKSKTISLCASADASATKGYLIYRYGRIGHPVELEYPSIPTPPAKAFSFACESGAKGGTEQLSFRTGGYVYTLYSDHWSGADQTKDAGVIVEKDGRRLANIECTNPLAPMDMYYLGVDELHFSKPEHLHFVGLPCGKTRIYLLSD